MSRKDILLSVFTKPWNVSIPEIGRFVSGLGFDAVELPVRPGCQVEPERVAEGLPEAVKQLADVGVAVTSIAGPTDEPTIAACAGAGVPVIRTMVSVGGETYMQMEDRVRRDYEALVPVLDRYGVTLGVQNHCGRMVCNAAGLMRIVGGFDPRHIAVVWDAAHNALQGEEPEIALDMVWSHLCMVNLKNGYWQRRTDTESEHALWKTYWTDGRSGLASWPRVVGELRKRDYRGVICLTAEYAERSSVDSLIAQDIAFAKSLLDKP